MSRFWTRRSRTCLASLLGLLAAAALALAACGGDEAVSGGGTQPPAASSSPAGTHGEIATGPSPSASAPSMAVSYTEAPLPPERAISPGTVGWKFKPTVDVEVTALGCYDADGDGLALAHRVGIFDGPTKRLLGSVTVQPKSTLDGAFRWASLEAPLVLQAGHFYLVGTADRTQVEQVGRDSEQTCETCYDQDSAGRWAPEIAFGGLCTSYRFGGPEFTAPNITKQVNAFIQVAWMSPNFKFRPVRASLPTSAAPSHAPMNEQSPASDPPQEPIAIGDGAYRWNAPGTASLAQTQAVARRYAEYVADTGELPGGGLYSANATLDFWPLGWQMQGAGSIRRAYRQRASDPDAGPGWQKRYHLLAGPGAAICEGMFMGTSESVDLAPYLVLLAVDGDNVAHEEIFLGGTARQPVAACGSAPGPGDSAEVAAGVAVAVGKAFAIRDAAAMQALLGPDVLFRDVTDPEDVRGQDAVLSWLAAVAPAKAVEIKNRAPIGGPGWAVVRWTARHFYQNWYFPSGVDESRNGATVIEVRDGKVVRMTIYLEPGEGGGSILRPQ